MAKRLKAMEGKVIEFRTNACLRFHEKGCRSPSARPRSIIPGSAESQTRNQTGNLYDQKAQTLKENSEKTSYRTGNLI